MIRYWFFFLVLIGAADLFGQARELKTEKVNWREPILAQATEFNFQTEELHLIFDDCKIFEIESESGVTGYFVLGYGFIEIDNQNIKEGVTAAMIRLNPEDGKEWVSMVKPVQIDDIGFHRLSLSILNDVFRHCYHSGMDALIPEKGVYAVNFFGEKSGEYLATISSQNQLKLVSFNR